MNVLKFLYLILLLSASSHAGERGYIVFIWSDDESKKIFSNYRNEHADFINNRQCWKMRMGNGIDIAYTNLIPEGLGKDLVENALSGNEKSISKVQSILEEYNDENIDHGFDGMLSLEMEGDIMSVFSLPTKKLIKPLKFTANITTNKTEKLDKLLCESLSYFDSYFSP
ncbi:hypothetical protein CYR32_12520 [Chimaeribacter coloradensis]|uniref:Uncharacterized protein n=1 Tax=Chimaeribacter coloradensis TaxID=2060068 RepID=A0A2N5E203_9GAMM|nr:hypothetical protein [Chimaeribacter coloradensis]PLR34483.1 hypothetical protein CYR32_12520 [Chimaeribacter coloradensis]